MILCVLPRKGGSAYDTDKTSKYRKRSGSESGFPEAGPLSHYGAGGAKEALSKRKAGAHRNGAGEIRRMRM